MTAVAVGSVTLPKPTIAAKAKPAQTPRREAMPTRSLGKTGYKVGIFSLGSQASLGKPHNENIAVPIIEKGARSRRELHRRIIDLRVNAADSHHFSFSEQLLPVAVEKQMGIIGMKVPARGRILATWTPPPIEQQKHMWEGMVLATTPSTLHMRKAMYYSWSLPVSTVIIGCDAIRQLEKNVQLARAFTPLSQQPMVSLTHWAEPVSKQSLFFRFYERARRLKLLAFLESQPLLGGGLKLNNMALAGRSSRLF